VNSLRSSTPSAPLQPPLSLSDFCLLTGELVCLVLVGLSFASRAPSPRASLPKPSVCCV
jgi:hypothetical protein